MPLAQDLVMKTSRYEISPTQIILFYTEWWKAQLKKMNFDWRCPRRKSCSARDRRKEISWRSSIIQSPGEMKSWASVTTVCSSQNCGPRISQKPIASAESYRKNYG